MGGPAVTIRFNGEAHSLPQGSTVADCLAMFDLDGKPVAVELNREVLPRELRDAHVLSDGDALEVVSLIGGG